MIGFLRLIRPINLLVIVFTMYMLRYFLLTPMVQINGYVLQLADLSFLLLVASTVMVAAGGYIINDYFDLRADRINKPNRVLIGKFVSRRKAMAAHLVLTLSAILIGIYLSWKVHIWKLAIIHIFSAASLWYYSLIFKREFLIGNVVIALLAGLVPFLVGVFEIPLLVQAYGEDVRIFFEQNQLPGDYRSYFNIMFYWIMAYAGFAFFSTLIREIQKDIADKKGDERVGCRTLPIVLGDRIAKWIVALLLLVLISALYVSYYLFLGDPTTLWYFSIGIVLPLFLSLFVTIYANKRKQYLIASNLVKLAMGTAVFYCYLLNLGAQ